MSYKQHVHVPANICSTDTGLKANENSLGLHAAINYAANFTLTVGRGCLCRSYLQVWQSASGQIDCLPTNPRL
jgi:hypothetical protein